MEGDDVREGRRPDADLTPPWTASPEDPPVVERKAVRLVVLDRSGRILLFKIREPLHPEQGTNWELPGGGIDPGESYLDAARRELAEETGIRASEDDIGQPHWQRRVTFLHAGERRLQDEVVVTVRVDLPSPSIDPRRQSGDELDAYLGSRWWSVEEIETSTEHFYPGRFPELLRGFLAGKRIREPFEFFS